MESLYLEPKSSVSGEVILPGSKSLSNRILLLAALCRKPVRILNILDSDDVRWLREALQKLGVNLEFDPAKAELLVQNEGTNLLDILESSIATSGKTSGEESGENEPIRLFLGNAGTAMRPLAAVLAGVSGGDFLLEGEPRMYERPIGHLVAALRMLGADVSYAGTPDYPPLQISGKKLQGGLTRVPGNISSQYLTALLMAAPVYSAEQATDIEVVGELVSKPYITITLDTLQRFGIEVDHQEMQKFHISARQQYQSPGTIAVEGDASSASYFLAAAAIAGGTVRVCGVGKSSVQGDVAFAWVLQQMGAQISWGSTPAGMEYIECSRGGPLQGQDLDLNHIPDAAMTIGVVALFASGKTTIRNVANWRVKETDRLAAMSTELRKTGAKVEEGSDYITIEPPVEWQHAAVDTYNDHRMAMCFSLAAFGPVGVTINDPGCTSKTYPQYFEHFLSLCGGSL